MDYDFVSRVLHYDGIMGSLTWAERPNHLFSSKRACASWNGRYAGSCAMTALSNGYLTGRIMGKTYYAHRVAWLMMHKEWPSMWIDHINGDRADNRSCNLRQVNKWQNARNTAARRSSTSGFLGVSWNTRRSKWECRIKANGKLLCLGMFSDEVDAAMAYNEAAKLHFGDYARLNVLLGAAQ